MRAITWATSLRGRPVFLGGRGNEEIRRLREECLGDLTGQVRIASASVSNTSKIRRYRDRLDRKPRDGPRLLLDDRESALRNSRLPAPCRAWPACARIRKADHDIRPLIGAWWHFRRWREVEAALARAVAPGVRPPAQRACHVRAATSLVSEGCTNVAHSRYDRSPLDEIGVRAHSVTGSSGHGRADAPTRASRARSGSAACFAQY